MGVVLIGALFAPTAQAAASTLYVGLGGGSGSCSAPTYTTIQAAVTAAGAGDTVFVCPGTYAENVDVTQSVTIQGSGQGVTIVEPAVSNPNCGGAGGGSLCTGGSNVFLVQADNVTISGLAIDGDNPGLTSGIVFGGADIDARNGIITNHLAGIWSGLSIHDVTVRNIYLRGIYASSGGTFDFEHDTVTNVQADPASIGMFNFGGSGTFANNTVSWANDAISSNYSQGTQFTGNVVTNSGSGIHTDNSGGVGVDTISGNTVSNCMPNGYGIWDFVPSIATTISDNTVNNCLVGLGAFSGPTVTTVFSDNRVDGAGVTGSIGAWVSTTTFWWGDANVAATFDHNTIVHNDTGVRIDETPSSGATASVALHYNVIAGNATAGLTTNSAGPVDAINNWWGCSGGSADTANCNGVTGNVNATPWLVDQLTLPTVLAVNTPGTIRANLTYNSNGVQPGGTLPDGAPVTFSLTSPASGVTMSSTSATTTGGVATTTITAASVGVYALTVCAKVPTTYGATECQTVDLAVYDPTAGFVTGGGWINSPSGAYKADLTLAGKATFGFVSRYQKGATVPSGHTAFVFKTGNLDFQSTAYQWLIVNQNGSNAQFKGTGTINGAGTYDFMIWATDNGSNGDTFRIQITDSTTGATVYDDGVQQVIGGGSIIVHS